MLATQAPSSMTMSRPLRGMASWRSRPNLLMSWVPVRTETLWPKKAYSPTVMSPEPTLKSALLTTAVGWMWGGPGPRGPGTCTSPHGPRGRPASGPARPAPGEPARAASGSAAAPPGGQGRHPRLLFLAVRPVDPGRPSIASAVATPEVGDGAWWRAIGTSAGRRAAAFAGPAAQARAGSGRRPIATTISLCESQSTAPLPPSRCQPPRMSSAARRSSMAKFAVRSASRSPLKSTTSTTIRSCLACRPWR